MGDTRVLQGGDGDVESVTKETVIDSTTVFLICSVTVNTCAVLVVVLAYLLRKILTCKIQKLRNNHKLENYVTSSPFLLPSM